MNADEVRQILAIYQRGFDELNIPKEKAHLDLLVESETTALAHCNWMLDEIETLLCEGEMEKAFRWLGFIQGVLYLSREFTIDEMRD